MKKSRVFLAVVLSAAVMMSAASCSVIENELWRLYIAPLQQGLL